jgi:hypothetical protein
MIILNTDQTEEDFENWMIGRGEYNEGFLPKMFGIFENYPEPGRGLLKLQFLKGHKEREGLREDLHPLKSEEVADRSGSTSAGANSDYAWITYWSSLEANHSAWKNAPRPGDWYNDDHQSGYWNQFLLRCYPREDFEGAEGNITPSRPKHGQPYDYLGVSGALEGDVSQIGRGAGCLVEGFTVLKEWTGAEMMTAS